MLTAKRLIVAIALGAWAAAALAETADRGILGRKAPELKVSHWIGADGKETDPVTLSNYRGKVVYLYFFQSWCPGCHRYGFPTMAKLSEEFKDDDRIAFLAVQTVFEGHGVNTSDQLAGLQRKYDINAPFGHDGGKKENGGIPSTMRNFRSAGTPWVVVIDPSGTVIFNDFHIDPAKATLAIRKILEQSVTTSQPAQNAESESPPSPESVAEESNQLRF